MALVWADRVRDTSTTTGTGDLTLSGSPPTGFQAFSAALSTNDTCYGFVAHQSANEWEVDLFTLQGDGTLARTTTLASSNSGSPVSFSSGTKDVMLDVPAAIVVAMLGASYVTVASSSSLTSERTLAAGTGITVTDNGAGSTVEVATTASTLPVSDATAVVKGSSDATKLLRFEVDGFTTGTTRVLTPPNQNGTVAVLEAAQTFTVGPNTFNTGSTSTSAIIVKQASGQSEPPQQWLDYDNTVIMQVRAGYWLNLNGQISLGDSSPSFFAPIHVGNPTVGGGVRWPLETKDSAGSTYRYNFGLSNDANNESVLNIPDSATATFKFVKGGALTDYVLKIERTGVMTFANPSSTTNGVTRAVIEPYAVDNTHGSRKYGVKHYAYDTAARECLTIAADGSDPQIGFLSATPVVRQASGADLTNNVTAGGTDDTIANFTDLVTYANDAATIRNDIYQLARKLKQVNDALRDYGLLT